MTIDREEFRRQEDELDDLYREVIIDHYRNPRHHGALPDATASHEGYNPLCGDEVTVDILLDDDRIADVAYRGAGCSISQSSASMMTEAIAGKTLPEVRELFREFTQMMQSSDEAPESLGDLEALAGVRKFPVRVKCATLAWHTLQEALRDAGKGAA